MNYILFGETADVSTGNMSWMHGRCRCKDMYRISKKNYYDFYLRG